MKSSCSHPVCKEEFDNLPTWFNGSPSIAYLPLPIPNPEKLMEVTVVSAKVIAMGILLHHFKHCTQMYFQCLSLHLQF